MPTGTGANILSTLPEVPYVIDPASFAQMTERNVQSLPTINAPGMGNSTDFFFPRSGVCSYMRIVFQGTLTVTIAGTQPVPSARWPYGLLSNLSISAGLGASTFNCDGLDLYALKIANRPFVTPLTDQFPGAVGGGGTAPAAGSYPLYLTWDVPIAVDQSSLIASMFLQSTSSTVQVTITQDTMADLIAPGGTATDWTITGTFTPVLTIWDIPVSQKGELILPEVNKVHLFQGINQSLNGTGDQSAPVQRTAGILQRLFLRGELNSTSFLSALPSAAAANQITDIEINYGLVNTPLIFKPASVLAEMNNQWYGAPLPYDTYCWDTLREFPGRDAILLQGITDLKAIVGVNTAVTVPVGAVTHLVEEILI